MQSTRRAGGCQWMREMIAPTLPWAPLLRLLDTSTGIPTLKGPNIESNTQASDSYPIPPLNHCPPPRPRRSSSVGASRAPKLMIPATAVK